MVTVSESLTVLCFACSCTARIKKKTFPKGTVPFEASNVPFGASLGLPQKKQCALWFHLKTNIFLTATWTAWIKKLSGFWILNLVNIDKCFVDSCTTCNKRLVVTIAIHSRWGVWSWDYFCLLACKFWWEHCQRHQELSEVAMLLIIASDLSSWGLAWASNLLLI